MVDSLGGTTKYTYDAWDGCTVIQDLTDCGIATVNPFRYRGYYYDEEIGMYYLQSRYYNPCVGRFVNGDEWSYLIYCDKVLLLNFFLYGNNDAVDNTDEYGYWSIPRGAVAFVVDALFMVIPVFGVAFAPIKSIAKEYGKFALKNKVREPLAN